MTAARGTIRCREAYAQGKMADSSAWSKLLVRNITPSDIDLIWDNAGRILLGELSRKHVRWQDVPFGQKLLYENLVRLGCEAAVLLNHSTPLDKYIDTCYGIDWFSVMWKNSEGHLAYTEPLPGKDWPSFVQRWYKKK